MIFSIKDIYYIFYIILYTYNIPIERRYIAKITFPYIQPTVCTYLTQCGLENSLVFNNTKKIHKIKLSLNNRYTSIWLDRCAYSINWSLHLMWNHTTNDTDDTFLVAFLLSRTFECYSTINYHPDKYVRDARSVDRSIGRSRGPAQVALYGNRRRGSSPSILTHNRQTKRALCRPNTRIHISHEIFK